MAEPIYTVPPDISQVPNFPLPGTGPSEKPHAPPPQGKGPYWPPPDETIQTFQFTQDSIRAYIQQYTGLPDNMANIVALIVSFPVLVGAVLFKMLVWSLVNFAGPLGVATLEAMFQLREQARPAVNNLTGAALQELLGVQVDATNWSTDVGPAANLARAKASGGVVFDLLASEFAPGGVISEAQGLDAARTFTGFVVDFAVSSSFISMLGEALSFGHLREFRELGVQLARNLGLGRLSREALKPLVTTTVATPLQWQLNAKYRPTKPAEAVLVRAYHAGIIDQPTFETEMARLGYSDTYVKVVESDLGFHVTDVAAERAVRWHIISPQDAITLLRASGLTQDEAGSRMTDIALSRKDTRWDNYISEIETAYKAGFITLQRFQDLLQTAPLTADEITLAVSQAQAKRQAGYKRASVAERRQFVGRGWWTADDLKQSISDEGYVEPDATRLADLPAAQISVADYKTMYYAGTVTLTDWKTRLDIEGYSEDEKSFATLQLLHDFDTKVTAKKAKGLSVAEIKTAFKQSLLSAADVEAKLKAAGYSDASVALLKQEITGSA